MFKNSSDINHAQFIEAACIVATVLADRLWNATHAPEPVRRPQSLPTKALSLQDACRYLGMGRTKFRELVEQRRISAPVMNGRRPTWLIKDLDRYLADQEKLRR